MTAGDKADKAAPHLCCCPTCGQPWDDHSFIPLHPEYTKDYSWKPTCPKLKPLPRKPR